MHASLSDRVVVVDSPGAAGSPVARARIAGVLVTVVGGAGTYWIGRHTCQGLTGEGGADQVATTAFCVALTLACGWLTVLTALATAAVDDVGCHSQPGQLQERLVRRMAATLLVVGGTTAALVAQSGQVQARGTVATAPAFVTAPPDMPAPAVVALVATGGSDAIPDPSFDPAPNPAAWLPKPPPSSRPTDGSLVTGTPHSTPAPTELVVRKGDCLWSIVSRHLGAGADAAVIAQEVQRWYAANQQLIGPDADLLQPGQILKAPMEA